MINDYEFRQSVVNMRRNGQRTDVEAACWSEKEQIQLRQLFVAGTGLTAIAVILRRTEPEVIHQAMRMELFAPPKCVCHTCRLDPDLCPRNQIPDPTQEDD